MPSHVSNPNPTLRSGPLPNKTCAVNLCKRITRPIQCPASWERSLYVCFCKWMQIADSWRFLLDEHCPTTWGWIFNYSDCTEFTTQNIMSWTNKNTKNPILCFLREKSQVVRLIKLQQMTMTVFNFSPEENFKFIFLNYRRHAIYPHLPLFIVTNSCGFPVWPDSPLRDEVRWDEDHITQTKFEERMGCKLKQGHLPECCRKSVTWSHPLPTT